MSQEAATATERYFEVMDEQPESTGTSAIAYSVAVSDGSSAVAAGKGEGGLRFHGVQFRYPDAPADAPPVLDRIDLHIRPASPWPWSVRPAPGRPPSPPSSHGCTR